jgi:hypothetical protein
MPEADVDYEGKELTSFAAAVAYSETTGRDVFMVGGAGMERARRKVARSWWNINVVSVPSTIATSSTISITTIIATIATSITAV